MSGLDPLKGVVNNKEEKSSYTQKIRDQAVKLIAEQGCKIPDVARNLGINERAFFLGGGALAAEIGEGRCGTVAFHSARRKDYVQVELARLKKKNQ